jgi:hypothetical protein
MRSTHRSFFVCLLTCTFTLGFLGLSRADDAMVRQARDELQQAESTSNLDQQAHLKSALGLLNHLPSGYKKKSRGAAIQDIKAALFEAGQGDPDSQVVKYIHDAEDALLRLED